MKKIAATGRTVICTIHQPRADIWHVFDNVVLLVTGGRAAYTGRADGILEYLQEAGHVAPPFTNLPGTWKSRKMCQMYIIFWSLV